jgi:NADH dehydrogenase
MAFYVVHAMNSTRKHRVVIIGGGFGGLDAAKALRHAPVEVTLIDKRNFHLFTPMLYQVATGGLSPGDITAPLRHILSRQQNAQVLMGEVTAVDTTARIVYCDQYATPYDSLIVAAGATHDYFAHPEWADIAPGLKTIEDAITIRTRIFRAFENAEREDNAEERQRYLTFVIVGGGATGVELAGALGEIAHDTLKRDFRRFDPGSARIFLIEASPRVLAQFPEGLSVKAARSLTKLGVTVLTGHRVTEMNERSIVAAASDKSRQINCATIIWSAGIRAYQIGRWLVGAQTELVDRQGRVKVAPDMTIPGHPDIFVVGDLAVYSHQTGTPLPGTCPVAMSQGRYVADVIARRLRGQPPRKFRYVNKGELAVIGRAAAVADFGWWRVSGFLAWVLWLFVHLMYLVEFENRVLVFIQWGYSYFTFKRGARLITFEDRNLGR